MTQVQKRLPSSLFPLQLILEDQNLNIFKYKGKFRTDYTQVVFTKEKIMVGRWRMTRRLFLLRSFRTQNDRLFGAKGNQSLISAFLRSCCLWVPVLSLLLPHTWKLDLLYPVGGYLG